MKPFKHLIESMDQTNTLAFKKWFKKSKVVNNSGNPLVCYHGSPSGNFKSFNISSFGKATDTGMFGQGFYFSPDSKVASSYAKGKGSILPVYLSIQKPFIISTKADIPNIEVPEETIEDLENSAKNYSIEFTKLLKSKKYDGVISKLTDEYIVFKPNQIKSAIGNNGNFNPKSDNINEKI